MTITPMAVLRPLLGAVITTALLAGTAAATPSHRADRNRDGIPDRWERAHHLSLRVNQANRDQDRDGLRNLAEYRLGTDPRSADSNGDGIVDALLQVGAVRTVSGAVVSFDAATGALVVQPSGGVALSVLVDASTTLTGVTRSTLVGGAQVRVEYVETAVGSLRATGVTGLAPTPTPTPPPSTGTDDDHGRDGDDHHEWRGGRDDHGGGNGHDDDGHRGRGHDRHDD